jgi:hypothetical protein
VACTKEACCAEVQACADEPSCSCWIGCILDGGTIELCFGECGAPDEALFALIDCGEAACADECAL